MGELKRTILYAAHQDAGATLVDFGGWEMPIQYPSGIIAEHLYCRSRCAIFDVSHMGRVDVAGPEQVAFLQHVLSSNVLALDVGQAQPFPQCDQEHQRGQRHQPGRGQQQDGADGDRGHDECGQHARLGQAIPPVAWLATCALVRPKRRSRPA